MKDLLQLPRFARADEYCSLWLIESNAFRLLWKDACAIDFKAHMASTDKLRVSVERIPVAGRTSIAAITLAGVLMKQQSSIGGTSTIQARREIRQAANDPDVGAILLLIDSPGGTVAGTDDLAAEVRAAAKIKPVVAHIDDMTASAAYWVASQADRVTANSPTALVGSIGTLWVIDDESAAAEQAGVKTLVFKTGPLKGFGTPGAPVTEAQAAHVQGLVDSIQKNFDVAVQKGRGLSAKQLESVRHGGVFTAEEAVNNRLIDAIQPLSKTITELTRSLPSGRARADAGSAGPASHFPMVQRRRLPVLAIKVGSRVKVKDGKEHDAMAKGKTGTVKEIATPALGIKFDGMEMIHKWYVEDELEQVD